MKLLFAKIFYASLWAVAVSQGRSGCSPEACMPMMNGLTKNTQVHTDPRSRKIARKNNKLNRGCYSRGQKKLQYRNPDGSCNNLQTDFGSSDLELGRLLPAQYSDSSFSPRKFSTVTPGKRLPTPRDVSRAVHPDKTATSQLTIMMMQWGQFIDHELVSTPLPIDDTRGMQQCCGDNMTAPTQPNANSECFPIVFSDSNDPNFAGSCMEFLRSQPAFDDSGAIISPRENRNSVTAFLDASTVYGSNEERLEDLKDPTNRHLLRTTPDNFPPDNGLSDCVKRNSNDICFLAGDDRVNEHPALTMTHVMFVRYHNLVAKEIKDFAPSANDDAVFRLARAVVDAVHQQITYNDWLPILLGPSIRREFGLDLDTCTTYDIGMDPRIVTEFSTAAFRIGHTLIPRTFPLTPTRRVALREIFFQPFEARENLDSLAEGILTAIDPQDRTQPSDNFIVEEVTAHLFENQEGARQGFDLVSINIQRGRDHGIPPYNDVRAVLGLPAVKSFADSALGVNGARMGSVYDHVDDMDLFPAGMSEPLHDGGLAGETFSRLIGEQFHRLRVGDRFFFDINPAFNERNLDELSKMTLAHIFCMTTNIARVQKNVFRIPGPNNPVRSCNRYRSDNVNFKKLFHKSALKDLNKGKGKGGSRERD